MNFKPLGERVVVRRTEELTKSRGGILIPDNAQERPVEGEVVAVGPGARDDSGNLIPTELKPGDRILYGKWTGTEIKVDGEELLIMNEKDVLGVLAPAPKLVAVA